MLNYFNFKKEGSRYLITNDLGRYIFIDESDFKKLISNQLDTNTELWRNLEENFFVYEGSRETFLSKIKYPLQEANRHLIHSTSLHIFVLTNACNLQCIYCQARTGDEKQFNYMDFTTARKAVDFALQCPDHYLTFEFQGGEPLLNFKTLRFIVEYSESHKKDKEIEYNLVSNLILLNDEIISFIKKNHINLSTSLDGNSDIHDYNRPFVDGSPSYHFVIDKINHLQQLGIYPGAIETTTRKSLSCPNEIVNTYLDLGINCLFLRPLTPLGYAYRDWKSIGYTPEEFLEFYKKCFDYIIQINQNGTFFKEGHASIFLEKILGGVDPNYMELRSPCGGVLGQLAYFFNGSIYTCDEGRMLGEMGNDAFLLGNVYHSNYADVSASPRCKAIMSSSFLQSIPECTDCVYAPYCGTCPVVNYALYGDIYPSVPNNYKCKIYKGMLDILFSYLDNSDNLNIFRSWIEQ